MICFMALLVGWSFGSPEHGSHRNAPYLCRLPIPSQKLNAFSVIAGTPEGAFRAFAGRDELQTNQGLNCGRAGKACASL
jgi:hypothetical protein